MVDSPNYNGDGDNRPKLKKVKRPIKRFTPGEQQGYVPPKSDVPNRPNFNVPARTGNVDAFSLDSYLDEDNSENEQMNQFVSEERKSAPAKSNKFMVGNLFTRNAIIVAATVSLFFGIIISSMFSGGGEKVVQDGLQGVVINPEVPRGRARCGVAERTQGCVLYIMNPQRQELNARDFYDLASQLTGRQKFVIETGNIRYSNIKIKPGAIAQFNIPPLIN